jgi:hypothetical protein
MPARCSRLAAPRPAVQRYWQHDHFAVAYAHPAWRATRCNHRMGLDHRGGLDHRLGVDPSWQSGCRATGRLTCSCGAAWAISATGVRSAPARTEQTQPTRDSRCLDTSSRPASHRPGTHLRGPCLLAPGSRCATGASCDPGPAAIAPHTTADDHRPDGPVAGCDGERPGATTVARGHSSARCGGEAALGTACCTGRGHALGASGSTSRSPRQPDLDSVMGANVGATRANDFPPRRTDTDRRMAITQPADRSGRG